MFIILLFSLKLEYNGSNIVSLDINIVTILSLSLEEN